MVSLTNECHKYHAVQRNKLPPILGSAACLILVLYAIRKYMLTQSATAPACNFLWWVMCQSKCCQLRLANRCRLQETIERTLETREKQNTFCKYGKANYDDLGLNFHSPLQKRVTLEVNGF